jgi:glutamate N-acetyltransferase/amino-acid N-acetyltransferase
LGFFASGVAAGIKPDAQLDLALVTSEPPAQMAAVFTQNVVKAAPVIYSLGQQAKKHLAQAVLINSGNANACTGAQGMTDVLACTAALAQSLPGAAQQTWAASTGVIGVALPTQALISAVPSLVRGLTADARGATKAAQAILTTDRVAKMASLQVRAAGRSYHIGAMAKGAGMIHPNMATMLAVVSCDAPLTRAQCRRLLLPAIKASFNAACVDGDTSTNDCVFFLANGAKGGHIAPHSAAEAKLGEALAAVCMQLAEAIVTDGEGASKLLVFDVLGARTNAQAQQIARCVVSSPLVKTALTGADPNWGRIVAAAGRAGVAFDPNALMLQVGAVKLVARGCEVPNAAPRAQRLMRHKRVHMTLRVGDADGQGRALGCDLTHGYVDINAHYRS